MKSYQLFNIQKLWIICLAVLIPCALMAEIPQKINFQGFLTNNDGVAVTDGLYDITFSIWDTDTPIDGHQLWQETLQVNVTNGIYNAYLGSDTPLNDPDKNGDTSDALTFTQPYYLGIQVKGDSSYITFEGKLLTLSSVGSAFRAQTSSGKNVISINSNYIITDADDFIFASGEILLTLPDAKSNRGKEIAIKKIDTKNMTVSIVTQNAQTIDDVNRDTANGGETFVMDTQYQDITLISNGEHWYRIGKANINDIPDNAIKPEKLSDGIPYTKITIEDNHITGAKISDNSIPSEKLIGQIGIDKLHLTNGDIAYTLLNLTKSIQASDLAPDAVQFSANDLADGSIGAEKLAGNITYDKLTIEDNQISGDKIFDSSIHAKKLAGDIGLEKLHLTDGIIPYTLLNLSNSIKSTDLAPDAVNFSADDLPDNSIGADKLAGQIGAEKLSGSIGYDKLAIGNNEIPGNTIVLPGTSLSPRASLS